MFRKNDLIKTRLSRYCKLETILKIIENNQIGFGKITESDYGISASCSHIFNLIASSRMHLHDIVRSCIPQRWRSWRTLLWQLSRSAIKRRVLQSRCTAATMGHKLWDDKNKSLKGLCYIIEKQNLPVCFTFGIIDNVRMNAKMSFLIYLSNVSRQESTRN